MIKLRHIHDLVMQLIRLLLSGQVTKSQAQQKKADIKKALRDMLAHTRSADVQTYLTHECDMATDALMAAANDIDSLQDVEALR